jgi:CheY-like chemotaxis protein
MKSVLLIEDDETFHYLCKRAFKNQEPPVELMIAFDGVEALELLEEKSQTPDLILVDINMPRMNGHEFLEEYSKRSPGSIPVVAMLSSSEDQRDRDKAMKYDFVQDYLVKPLVSKHMDHLREIFTRTKSSSSEADR